MFLLEHRTFFGQKISDIVIKPGEVSLAVIQDVGTKQAFSRTHLYDVEGRGVAEDFPHLLELPSDEVAKDRMDIGAGVKIALRPDLFPG